jgi:hypothetical protein
VKTPKWQFLPGMTNGSVRKEYTVRGLKISLLLALAFCLIPAIASATWEAGGNYIGPSIGLSFLGSAPQFGVNFEHAIETESMGIIGIGGVFRYWAYSEDFGFFNENLGKWKYSNTLVGAQGNYHFALGNDAFDPWAGLVLAYDVSSVSWDGPGGHEGYSSPSAGGLWLAAEGGARYFISPTIAISGRIGFGSLSYGALEVGLDFKF